MSVRAIDNWKTKLSFFKQMSDLDLPFRIFFTYFNSNCTVNAYLCDIHITVNPNSMINRYKV